ASRLASLLQRTKRFGGLRIYVLARQGAGRAESMAVPRRKHIITVHELIPDLRKRLAGLLEPIAD
ncbi:MAG: hypothetical protein ACREO0_15390, partial [Pseudoxanthomonas sp.]